MTQPHVILFGSSGMLGQAVIAELVKRDLPLTSYTHQQWDISDTRTTFFQHARWPVGSVVINCAGVVPETRSHDWELVAANALGPHVLAAMCSQRNIRLVHISTDCVFSGRKRSGAVHNYYLEGSVTDPVDLYGRSKLAGEVTSEPHLTIRASFIGSSPRHGLIHWLTSLPKEEQLDGMWLVKGWTDHFWNGTTAPILARYILDHLAFAEDVTGILHISGGVILSKCSLVECIVEKFNLPIFVSPVEIGYCDRVLANVKVRQSSLPELPSIYGGIEELANAYKTRED